MAKRLMWRGSGEAEGKGKNPFGLLITAGYCGLPGEPDQHKSGKECVIQRFLRPHGGAVEYKREKS